MTLSKSYIRKVALATVAQAFNGEGIPPWPFEQGYVSVADTEGQLQLSMELQRIATAMKPKTMPKPKYPKEVLE